MLIIRSAVFFIGQVATIFVYTPICFLVFPLPAVLRSKIIATWARFIMRFLNFTCNLDYEIEGIENVPSIPTVILAKHQSAWETIAFQAIFPPHAWVLKRELLWLPFFGWALAATNQKKICSTTMAKLEM